MPLAIEKNVPVPGQRKGAIMGLATTLEAMQPGDSVFVAGKTPNSIAGSVTWMRSKHPDQHWTTRTVEGGCRIWRIK